MAREPGCVVGIDGLPLGTKAVVVVDGVVVAELDVTSEGGRPVDLDSRVSEAVGRAADLVDGPVLAVHIALLDDRASGKTPMAISDRLAEVGIELEVIDLADLDSKAATSGRVENTSSSSSDDASSKARALLAARWSDAGTDSGGDPGPV